jgi:hypothetical protein
VPDTGADIARNRALWTVVNAQFTDEDAYRAWASKEPTWGLFRVPERDLGVNGFVVHALHELYAPADAATHHHDEIAAAQWASQWPVEGLWAAQLVSRPGCSG